MFFSHGIRKLDMSGEGKMGEGKGRKGEARGRWDE